MHKYFYYAAYVGVVGQKKPETVFGAFWMATALGASAVFFISSFGGVMEAVIVLLVMLVLSYTCYLTAELLYGEGRFKSCSKLTDTLPIVDE